jgi:hypothetical protein
MENNLNEPAGSTPPLLFLDQPSISSLEETRKWAFFLSIIGFIGVGLMLLLGLFIGTLLDNLTSGMPVMIPVKLFSVLYFLIALFYFFPVLYLYRFAVQMKTALYETNQEKLRSSFVNLKSLFRFIGMITLIVVSLNVIIFATVIVVGIVHRF